MLKGKFKIWKTVHRGRVGGIWLSDIGKACISPRGTLKHCYVKCLRANIFKIGNNMWETTKKNTWFVILTSDKVKFKALCNEFKIIQI